MTTPTDDRPELLTVIAHMRAKPGQEQALRDALLALIAPTQAEDGYVNYDLHESVEEPGLFYFYENWETPVTSTPTWTRPTWSTSPTGSTS